MGKGNTQNKEVEDDGEPYRKDVDTHTDNVLFALIG